ncbi:hypothetical protein ABTJ99_21215, partial [Acinetobacter baumannii]
PMAKEEYVDLHHNQVRQAIRMILQDHIPEYKDLGLKEVQVVNNRTVVVRGENFYTHDRHFHYPHKIQHHYAIYQLLSSIERV